ncbi:hypothetical protein GIB67_029206 [Kingdonia uniflora]|uniref:RRM domain-containing protein n=1 Tax=Kingdonia uniflora TaxID=39325 RepID=A0A7J7NB54_9MAGN|nr:hypothetical protein GIB67_029206 [Kingdonia uniflora]
MTRKRDNSYFFSSQSLPKRSHFTKPEEPHVDDDEANKPTKPTSAMVEVTNLTHNCSVLNLKSRFEIYGCVSRLRVDRGIGYITFRSKNSAESAIIDSSNPFLGIFVDDRKVQVSWPNNSIPQWIEGIRLSSKLLRPEIPLSKRGRGNKLGGTAPVSPKNVFDMPLKGREIIAYDDLL